MRRLAEFVMRGNLPAALVAGLGQGMSAWLPPLTAPLGILGGAALGLVTLRRGPREGLQVLLLAVILAGLCGLPPGWGMLPLLSAAALALLPLWLVAWWLRRSLDLAQALGLGAGLAVLALLLAEAVLGDSASWWTTRLQLLLQPVFDELAAAGEGRFDSGELIRQLAQWMNALLALAALAGVMMSLLWARWWQALLYNPGGFRREFHALRMAPAYALAWAAVTLLGVFTHSGLLSQLAMLLSLPLLLAGLALMHALAASTGNGRFWLGVIYLLLVLAGGYTMPLLVMLAALDAWVDWRGRLAARGGDADP